MMRRTTYEKTVSHLTEVGSTLDIKVDGRVDFARRRNDRISPVGSTCICTANKDPLVPGQRVHHDGGGLGALQQVVVDNVHVLDSIVLVLVGKSLPVGCKGKRLKTGRD
jgi:hypothetical protein